MRRLYQSAVAIHTLPVFGIDALGLGLHVFGCDKRWTYLLVTVSGKLLAKRLHRVQFRVESRLYLQLVVDEQIDILLHALAVYDARIVVFVVRVLKLRAQHRFVVDRHDDGVALSMNWAAPPECGSHQ